MMTFERQPPGAGMRTRIVLTLLFLAAVINYIDRGSLSIAAPSLGKEMGLSTVQLGFLLSSFFWTYAIFQLGAGWLVDRLPVGKVFAAGFALWSLATIASGFAHGMTQLFVLRLLLGIGESVAFPCFAKVVAESFSADRRGLPNAVIDAGTKVGPAIGVLAGGFLVGGYGWRWMFIVLGMVSLIWLIPWLIWGPRVADRAASAPRPGSGPGYRAILRSRDAWGTFLGASCYTYAYFFLLTWLPKYLVDVRGLTLQQLGVLGSLPFLASAAAALIAGWLSDRWIRSGASPTLARKTMVVTGLLLSITALPAAIAPDLTQSMLLLGVAYIAFGIFASNLWAISQTLAGPAAGQWAGLQNCLGALSGAVAPIVTGFIVSATGSYNAAFACTAILGVVGAASYLFIVGKIEPIDWG